MTGDKDKTMCNYWNGLLSRRSVRIKTHLEKCRKFKLAKKELNEDGDLIRQDLSTSAEPPKKKRLYSYVRTSPDQKKQLGLQDARLRPGHKCPGSNNMAVYALVYHGMFVF